MGGRLIATGKPSFGIAGGAGILGVPGSAGSGSGGKTFGTLIATGNPRLGMLGTFGSFGTPGNAGIGSGSDGVIDGKSHTGHFAMKTQDEAIPVCPMAP
jgi:hypothetical protein